MGKTGCMDNFKEIFERFGEMLENGELDIGGSCTFDSVCSILKVDPQLFGKYVFGQVGLTGDDILKVYGAGDVTDCN